MLGACLLARIGTRALAREKRPRGLLLLTQSLRCVVSPRRAVAGTLTQPPEGAEPADPAAMLKRLEQLVDTLIKVRPDGLFTPPSFSTHTHVHESVVKHNSRLMNEYPLFLPQVHRSSIGAAKAAEAAEAASTAAAAAAMHTSAEPPPQESAMAGWSKKEKEALLRTVMNYGARTVARGDATLLVSLRLRSAALCAQPNREMKELRETAAQKS